MTTPASEASPNAHAAALTAFDSMSLAELDARLRTIRETAHRDAATQGIPVEEAFRALSPEALREIAIIAAKLRQKNSGPPKRKTPGAGAKQKVTVENAADLFDL